MEAGHEIVKRESENTDNDVPAVQRFDAPASSSKQHQNKRAANNALILVMEPQNPSPTKYFDASGTALRQAVVEGELMPEELCSRKSTGTELAKKKSHTITINCCNCEKIFVSRSAYEAHYRASYQQEPVYCCTVCGKRMGQYRAYQLHSYRHINSANQRYSCQECFKTFHQKSDLVRHQNRHIATGLAAEERDAERKLQPISCPKCEASFQTQNELKEHTRKAHPVPKPLVECPDCGKYLSAGSIYSHRKIHSDTPAFACGECGRTFVQKINLVQHRKTHIGLRPYQCEQCKKSFCEKAHLQRHLNHHSEERPYRCELCGKCYKTERCLKVHSAVHTTERPFVCGECNKGFLSSSKLRQHSNIHSGLRPYKCNYCTRDFTNFPNWLKHIRRRHKVDHRTGEKLDSVPKFMTKKKSPEIETERKGDVTKPATPQKTRKRCTPKTPAPPPPLADVLKEESLPYVSESSNIDLNLVCKDDLIQPLAGEFEDIFQCMPSDETKLSIIDPNGWQLLSDNDADLFQCDLPQPHALDCAFDAPPKVVHLPSNDLIDSDFSGNATLCSTMASEMISAGPSLYDAQSPMFPTLISICGDEPQFRLINPRSIHSRGVAGSSTMATDSYATVSLSITDRIELMK
ncbi:zinc finger protein 3 homolog isoform X1 [Anopheles darlingi]|uniref:zinc finger protein 3 homolog isoform X1 n=1 Tax=Anopheles darlingi TaxID=43151 RepID=UPI0021000C64|nr:zinc finger protein 3 homolog isoform X1 [Anopheles darlingi]